MGRNYICDREIRKDCYLFFQSVRWDGELHFKRYHFERRF